MDIISHGQLKGDTFNTSLNYNIGAEVLDWLVVTSSACSTAHHEQGTYPAIGNPSGPIATLLGFNTDVTSSLGRLALLVIRMVPIMWCIGYEPHSALA